jgi:Flp pilus assembly protein TadD
VDEAIEACLNALKAEPDFPVAHNNLAIAYLEKGDREKAQGTCKERYRAGI